MEWLDGNNLDGIFSEVWLKRNQLAVCENGYEKPTNMATKEISIIASNRESKHYADVFRLFSFSLYLEMLCVTIVMSSF